MKARDYRTELEQILLRIDKKYLKQIEGLDEKQVIAMVEDNIVKLSDIDTSMPFEVGIYEMRDAFEEKYYVSLDSVIPEEEQRHLYYLLVDYKKEVA
jgi:hypothetical protein